MLKIDCLFKNTALINDIKKALRYIAEDRASKDRDASFEAVYNDMRKSGIEIDLSSAAHIYANELPLYDARFTPLADLEKASGKSFESTARNLVLQKPKDTEFEIGKLSPSQAAAKHIVDAFASKLIPDNTTKSIMRQLQEAMIRGSERLLGEKPEGVNEKAPKTTEEIIQAALDIESKGFRDINGHMNGIKKVFDATREEIERYTQEVENGGDEHTKELWNSYIDSFENAAYSLLFSRKEGKQILKEALLKDFGKDTKSGRVLDWGKLAGGINDITQLRDNVFNAFKGKYGEDIADKIANSLSADYKDLRADILVHADKTLAAKESQIDREGTPSKSDLTRLAELYDLGAFSGAHDKLLAHVLGIQESDTKAIDEVKKYAEQLSKLREVLQGNDFLAPSLQREVGRSINEIVARNMENKTSLLKSMSTMNKVYQVVNAAMVSGYRNLIENHLSGLAEYLTTKANVRSKLGGELGGFHKDDAKNMWDTWRNVAMGGREYGDAPYQVESTQLRVTDKYNLRTMKDADWSNPKTYVKALGSAVMTVPRAGLSGTDGAIKTGLNRLHFLSSMHDALVNTAKYTPQEAVAFINEAMYGEGALDRAKARAQEVYDATGIKYVSRKEINILANELLNENLLQGREVTPEMIKQAMASSFKQAGLGMGHESNNPVSKSIQSLKLYYQRQELNAYHEGNYNRAAVMKGYNTVVNSVMLRFMASQFNWAWLKVEQSGAGLISGLYHYHQGKKIESKKLVNLSEKEIAKMAEEYKLGRQKMFRGALGLAANVATTFIVMPALAKALYPDEDDSLQKMFDEMEDSYLAKALLLKTVPLWGMAQYSYHTMQNKEGDAIDKALATGGDVSQRLLGFGSSTSPSVRLAEGIKQIKSSSKKERTKGWTKVGQVIGNIIPSAPFYKQGKDVLETVDYFNTGVDPMYNYPFGFWNGLLGGGVMEDLGLLPDKPLMSIPYVGKSQLETFRYNGIESISDIKEKYGTGERADAFIKSVVGSGDRGEKAVKAYHAEVGE